MSKLHEFHTKVTGVTFDDPHSGLNRQEIIAAHVRPGMRVHLRPEPDNPVDALAVGVWVSVGGLLRRRDYQIGYLFQERAREVRALLQDGHGVDAKVTDVTGGTRDKPTYGVNLVIRWM